MSYHLAGNGWEGERPSRTFREYSQTLEDYDDDDGQMIRRPSHMRSSDYNVDEDETYGHSAVRSNKDTIPGLARPHSGEDTVASSKILSPRSASHTQQYAQSPSHRTRVPSSSAHGSRRSPSENGSSRDNWQSTTSRQPDASSTSYQSRGDSVPSNSNKLLGILNSSKPICSDYLAGRCRFGVLCHLRHALPTEDNVQTAQPSRNDPAPNQQQPSSSSWIANQGDRSSPPARTSYRSPTADHQRYQQNMVPPRTQYGQSNLQDDGWPAYKQLPPSLSAPVVPIAPEKPPSTSFQIARSSGWVSQDAAAQPSSRSEVASPKVDRLEREPVASSSKSAMEPGPRSQDNGWTRQPRPPSRSEQPVREYRSPPPVPQVPQQYSNHPTYNYEQDKYKGAQQASSSSGTQDDGWPAYKPSLRGWEEPIIPYSPANDRRESPAPIIRKKAVWTSLDPEFAGQTSDTYAEPIAASASKQIEHHRMESRGTAPFHAQASEARSVRTSTPPLQHSPNRTHRTLSPRNTISPPEQSPLRAEYASQQWQSHGDAHGQVHRPKQPYDDHSESWKEADAPTHGRKPSYSQDRQRSTGDHREHSHDNQQNNGWTSKPAGNRQDKSGGAPLMTLGEYLADEGSNEQVARLTGQTLAQVEDGQRSSNIQNSTITLPSGWSVPVEAFNDDSIRPSESASNIGGTTNSSSSAAEGRDLQATARPPRQGRQWQPYVGDTTSDTSSQEEKKAPSEINGTGWGADKWTPSSEPASPEAPASPQPAARPKSSWTVPQDQAKSAWLVPEQREQNGWRSPSQAAPLPAPTPRRGDAHDLGVVTDLERAATPRAAPSISKESVSQEPARETSGSSGRAISIIGASKYHAETMQLRDEIELLQEEKADLETRLASAMSDKTTQTQQPQSSNLEQENADLRAKIFAMETERETIRAIMVPILGILGLHGPKLEIRPIVPADKQGSAKKAQAQEQPVANGWK